MTYEAEISGLFRRFMGFSRREAIAAARRAYFAAGDVGELTIYKTAGAWGLGDCVYCAVPRRGAKK